MNDGMTPLSALQPRDRRLAGRVVATLSAVAGGVTVAFAVVAPGQQGPSAVGIIASVLTAVAVIGGAVLLQRHPDRGDWAWAVFPFAAVVAIVALDLITVDASVSAQIFFLFPALYAAFQLPRAGVIAVAAASIAGSVVDSLAVLPMGTGLVQSAFLAAALATCATLLVLSGERQDALLSQLRRQAAVDSLTGLVTRRVLDNAAASALSGAASELGTGLVLLDVDRFKWINDELGHPCGDEVLVQLAALLMDGTRPSDTISRMGGDEIAVLLAGCSVETLQRRAEQILWDVRAHPFVLASGRTPAVTVSIGVAQLPTHAVDLRSLYSAADASLYVAKRAGRDRIGPLPQEREAAHA